MTISRVSRPPAGRTLWVCDELPFAACYVYSPVGASDAAARSRLLRSLLKARSASWIASCARRVQREARSGGPLAGFFDPADVLVPVPGSAPSSANDSVAALLAAQLVRFGLGSRVWCALERIAAVPKSACAPHGNRPSVTGHFESLAVATSECPTFPRLTLVDDVVTKGRTLLAAAMRLHAAHPLVTVRGFALLRTMGLRSDIERLLDPCIGVIHLQRGDARRQP